VVFYEKVLRRLNRRGVKYVVAGGIAVNLHGVPRATADLDIVVEMSDTNIRKLVRVMGSWDTGRGFR
jgi:tRNA nucleotidyltransferase/poly(A) polymerase